MKNIKKIKEQVESRRTFFETLLEKEGFGLALLIVGCLLLVAITDFTLLISGQIIAAYIILSAVLEIGLLMYNLIYAPIWECKQYFGRVRKKACNGGQQTCCRRKRKLSARKGRRNDILFIGGKLLLYIVGRQMLLRFIGKE